jgi:hypothetical protein
MTEDIIECFKLLQKCNGAQQQEIVDLHDALLLLADGFESLTKRIVMLEKKYPGVKVGPTLTGTISKEGVHPNPLSDYGPV